MNDAAAAKGKGKDGKQGGKDHGGKQGAGKGSKHEKRGNR